MGEFPEWGGDAVQSEARVEQGRVEGLAVERDQGAGGREEIQQGFEHGRFLGGIAQEELRQAEGLASKRPTPTRNAYVPVPPARPEVSVSRKAKEERGRSEIRESRAQAATASRGLVNWMDCAPWR